MGVYDGGNNLCSAKSSGEGEALGFSCLFDFQFVLPGTNVEVVAAAKELICTGSCLLGEVGPFNE